MNATLILGIIIHASLFIVVMGFGLQAAPADLIFLFRRPVQLIKALISINVIMPLVAIALVKLFQLNPIIEVALVALAASPIPPIFPRKASKKGGDDSYSFGILIAVSFLSLFVVPSLMKITGRVFEREAYFSELSIVKSIAFGIVLPLAVGMVIRYFATSFAERFSKYAGKIGMIMLLFAVLPILIGLLPSMWSVTGSGTLLVMVVFAMIGIATGHLLGGPNFKDRAVLGVATASRHPAIAIALTSANVVEAEKNLAIASILLYFIVSALVALPYIKWAVRSSRAETEEPVFHI